jgi:hypothetical protein
LQKHSIPTLWLKNTLLLAVSAPAATSPKKGYAKNAERRDCQAVSDATLQTKPNHPEQFAGKTVDCKKLLR